MKYIFSAVNGQLNIKLDNALGLYPNEEYSLDFATVDLLEVINSIDVYNHSIIKKRFQFFEFANIAGAVPISITDAYIKLNELLGILDGSTSTPAPTTPKIIQSIPMQDALGVLVWKNILSDGTFTYTLQSGLIYAGTIALLQVPDLQTANNTKVVIGTAKGLDYTIAAGTYTKTQLETSYGNGLKICFIKALANVDVENSKVAITIATDTTTTLFDFVDKGSEVKTIKGYEEIADFVLTVQGGDASVFLTFFNNL